MKTFAALFIVIITIVSCSTPKKEYRHLQETKQIGDYETFLKKREKSKYAVKAKEELLVLYENRDWENAKKENTISGFEGFRIKYPQSPYYKEATKRKLALEEDRAWEKAFNRNTIADFEEFIARYPQSDKTTEANNKIAKLKEEAAWREATKTNTIFAYQNYTYQYPNGPNVKEAEKRMADLQEDEDWKIASNSRRVTQIEAFQKKYPNSRYTIKGNQLIAQINEENAWNLAKQQDSPEAYDSFIRDYPQSSYINQANELIQEMRILKPEWEKALKKNTPEAYQRFIDEYGYKSSNYRDKAVKKLDELDENSWSKAVALGSITGYRNYLKNYPSGMYVADAEKKIIDLEVEKIFNGPHIQLPPLDKTRSYSSSTTNNSVSIKNDTRYTLTVYVSGPKSEKVVIDPDDIANINLPNGSYKVAASVNARNVRPYAGTDRLTGGEYACSFFIVTEWERVYKKNTPEAYRDFIDEYGYRSSTYRDRAVSKLDELDEKYWSKAVSSRSITGYKNYLKYFPSGMYASEAEKKIIDLEVEKIFNSPHGKLPPLDRYGNYGYSNTNSVSISNDTRYTLTVLFSGPESERVVIKPNGSSKITLSSGTYRITASVNASNVRPYAGTDRLTGGDYSSSFYIVTERGYGY